MKLITNRIFTAKPGVTLEELLKQAQANSGQTKTAAGLDNFGDKKAKPFGKEEKKEEKKDEKPVDEKAEEPKSCEASAAPSEVKVAEEKKVETYDAGKTEGKLVNKPEEPKEAKAEGDKKPEPKKGKDGLPTSGQPQWEGKPENNNKPEEPTEKNTTASAEDLFKQVIASLTGKFEKFANLKGEDKKKVKDYFRGLYGEEYANAMVADK